MARFDLQADREVVREIVYEQVTARCDGCEWFCFDDDPGGVKEQAADHFEKTGHKVILTCDSIEHIVAVNTAD